MVARDTIVLATNISAYESSLEETLSNFLKSAPITVGFQDCRYCTTVLGWVAAKLSLLRTMCIIIVVLLILSMSHCLFRCVSLNMCL